MIIYEEDIRHTDKIFTSWSLDTLNSFVSSEG